MDLVGMVASLAMIQWCLCLCVYLACCWVYCFAGWTQRTGTGHVAKEGRRFSLTRMICVRQRWLVISVFLTTAPYTNGFARYSPGNVLLLDHLNINHEKGRHDLVRAFYYDVLGLSPDPRKAENMETGRKTLWANAGITQFHLPEAQRPQVFDGLITLAYPDVTAVEALSDRLRSAPSLLKETHFAWKELERDALAVRDPWGTQFRLVVDREANDDRGVQPGDPSAACAMSDLCVHVPKGRSLAGIRRFYDRVLGAPSVGGATEDEVSVVVSPQHTLTFKYSSANTQMFDGGPEPQSHEDLEYDDEGRISANHGPHVSMYVSDLRSTYQWAKDVGATFVNHRFKRRAYTLDDAIDQCMFRCLDIVDPDDPEAGPIMRLEHEVRSTVKKDGSKYKSCPFFEV